MNQNTADSDDGWAQAASHRSGVAGANPVVAAILASADVWDMTLPWLPIYWDLNVLARYKRAAYTFVSASLQDWPPTFEGMRRCIEQFKELAMPASAWLTFGSSLAEI